MLLLCTFFLLFDCMCYDARKVRGPLRDGRGGEGNMLFFGVGISLLVFVSRCVRTTALFRLEFMFLRRHPLALSLSAVV